MNPNNGPAGGGITVTISGSGFTGTTSVKFGNASATILSQTDTLLTVTAPPGINTVAIAIVSAGGSITQPAAFTYNPAQITSITPNIGPAKGGQTVTITGTSLDNASSVTFGGTLASAILSNTSTQIVATTPQHASGTVTVTVNAPQGNGTVNFTYLDPPSITNVAPAVAAASGGTTVTITGSGFISPLTVVFDTTTGLSLNVISTTELSVVTPLHDFGPITITLSNPDGQTATANFTYNGAPSLSGNAVVSPDAPITGQTVTVTANTTDPENDPVHISYDWGDTSVTTTGQHIYSAAGQYNIVLTLTDQYNAVVEDPITIIVTAPRAFGLTKLACSYKVGFTGKDVVQVSGTLPNVASIVLPTQTMQFTVGGAQQTFTFDPKGKAKGLTLKGKTTKTANGPKLVGGTLGVTAKFTGTFLTTWATALQFDPTTSAKKQPLTVVVNVLFNKILNTASVSAKLTSKANKNGAFKH